MKRVLSYVVAFTMVVALLVPSATATSNATGYVAKIDDKEYATLQEAINLAKEKDKIILLDNVEEDITIDKDVTIDGNNKFEIKGMTTFTEGMLQNLTLKPAEENETGSFLKIGSGENVKINMENVVLHYSVTKRSGGSCQTISGNKANIVINNCKFMNTPNNGTTTEDALEWSYGLYINGQSDEGSIVFTNNEFNGAFRTMLPGVSGDFTVENCKFVNSVYSVKNGPTSGAGSEATCITTSKEANNNIKIFNNTIDNAGALYFQTNAVVEDNSIAYDRFEHYIQVSGSVGEKVDFTDNSFVTGENDLVIIDVPVAPAILPVGQEAVSYWIWADTDASIRPADYGHYKYMYNEDGSKTFKPQSKVALEQFLHQGKGNLAVEDNDAILITKNMDIDKLDLDKNISLKIDKGVTFGIKENLNIKGNILIEGEGIIDINKGAKVSIEENNELTVTVNIINDGTIENDGKVTLPDKIEGDGQITGEGDIEKIHEPVHIVEKAPTCTADGNIAYWYCADCDKYFDSAELTNEIAKEATVVEALGHDFKDGICTVCKEKDPNYKEPVDGKGEEADKGNSDKDKTDKNSPETGDDSNTVAMAILMLFAAAGATGTIAYGRRKNK